MSAGNKSASERIADWLVRNGVERIFAVTGGGSMFLNHAFAAHPSLNCTYLHHEQACAMAAEGYARIAGRPALVNVTTGPGGINALNGVFGAYTDSIPMIVISGQVKRETWLTTTPVTGLRQLGDQEAPIVEMARPVTKAAYAVTSLEELSRMLPEAYGLATTGRPGPVWLDVPSDLQSSREPFEFQEYRSKPATRSPQLAGQVREIVQRLRDANRPVILAGTGVRLAKADARLLSLVETFGIPLATAWTHDYIASEHPLFAGRPGTIGTRAGNLCLQAADLVIVIGSRLNIRQVSYNWSAFARRAFIVQIDVDPAELQKPLVRAQMPIVADAGSIIELLHHALSTSQDLPNYDSWARWCRAIHREFPAFEPSNVSDTVINPYAAVNRVFAALPDRAVVACGNASACIIPFQIGLLKYGQRLFSNSGSASMGYELPAAIGAAVADSTRRVVCMAGDGSLQMNVQEFQTVVTLQLNVVIVVLANDGYLSIRLSHENFFGKVVGADRSSGLHCPDYTAVARAYGIRAFDIRENADLEGLAASIQESGPLLIQIHVDPKQKFSPKLQSRVDENGRFLTPELDDVYPFLAPAHLNAIRESAAAIRSEAGRNTSPLETHDPKVAIL